MTSSQERNSRIIELVDSGVKIGQVADMYGLSSGSIYRTVKTGRNCGNGAKKHVEPEEPARKGGNTLDLLRNKHPYNKGDKVHVKDDNGKYISATVKQRTDILFVLDCGDGLTRTVSFPDLAMDKELIKERG